MNTPEIIGRRSSHFTRLVLIVAHELGVEYSYMHVVDLMALDTKSYGDHPGLRLPTLKFDGEAVFGAVNICRILAKIMKRENDVVWPDEGDASILLTNMYEITMQTMASQVSLVIAVEVSKLDPASAFVTKLRVGMAGMLEWLDTRLVEYQAQLPGDRLISITEAALYCVYEHIRCRNTSELTAYPNLARFVTEFGQRTSAKQTPYRFDS